MASQMRKPSWRQRRIERLQSKISKSKQKRRNIMYDDEGKLRTDALSKREAKRHSRLWKSELRKKSRREGLMEKEYDAAPKSVMRKGGKIRDVFTQQYD